VVLRAGCRFVKCCGQVVAVAGSAAAAHEDVHSTEVATDALLSVLPACLEAGRPAAEAVAAVVEAALRLPPHRRLPLLTSLHAALPQVIGGQQAVHGARLPFCRWPMVPVLTHP
jgi:hypothetical protein